MRKVIILNETKRWWHEGPTEELLNNRLVELQKENWRIISVQANTNLFGMIASFTILVEPH